MSVHDFNKGAVVYIRTDYGEYLALFDKVDMGRVYVLAVYDITSKDKVNPFGSMALTDEECVKTIRLAEMNEICMFYSYLRKWSLQHNENYVK